MCDAEHFPEEKIEIIIIVEKFGIIKMLYMCVECRFYDHYDDHFDAAITKMITLIIKNDH